VEEPVLQLELMIEESLLEKFCEVGVFISKANRMKLIDSLFPYVWRAKIPAHFGK
jgi:hypothetical protein